MNAIFLIAPALCGLWLGAGFADRTSNFKNAGFESSRARRLDVDHLRPVGPRCPRRRRRARGPAVVAGVGGSRRRTLPSGRTSRSSAGGLVPIQRMGQDSGPRTPGRPGFGRAFRSNARQIAARSREEKATGEIALDPRRAGLHGAAGRAHSRRTFLVGYGKGRGTAWFDEMAIDANRPQRLLRWKITRDFLRPAKINPFQYGQFIEYLCTMVPAMWAEKLFDGSFEG